jgi:cell division protein FtsL
MQQSDTKINSGQSVTRYGFPNIKGSLIAAALLIAASFISGNQAKKRQVHSEAQQTNYDLSKFEKHIQESKQLLKKNRP